jgi:hypothetical protein
MQAEWLIEAFDSVLKCNINESKVLDAEVIILGWLSQIYELEQFCTDNRNALVDENIAAAPLRTLDILRNIVLGVSPQSREEFD